MSKSVRFSLVATIQMTDQEKKYIERYKMGQEIIFADERSRLGVAQVHTDGQVAAGVWKALTGLTITVNDLITGKKIDCDGILEMLHVKQRVEEACGNIKTMLDEAANFGGKEVIEL